MKIFFTRTKESMNVIFMVELLNRNINKNKFESKKGVFLAIIGKDKPIAFKNLEKICNDLECTLNDVFSFKESGNE